MNQVVSTWATQRNGVGIAGITLILALGVLAAGTLGPNFDLAALAAFTLVLGVLSLWRPGEPPILLFIFALHWVQASTAIFLANFANQTIDAYYLESGNAAEATALTLLALSAMALGIRLGAGPRNPDLQREAIQLASSHRMRDWFFLYLTAWVFGAAASMGAQAVPGLSQVLLSISACRWAFFFMFAVAHFSHGKRAGVFFPFAFLLELGLGLGSYFSDFKVVFVVTLIAAVTAGLKFTPNRVFALLVASLATIALGVVWTAIKSDYRAFVSGGARQQIVSVGYDEQLQKLAELTGRLDAAQINKAAEGLFTRLAYVEFFGSVLVHVPSQVPHENGAILEDAIARPFMPRLLFPDKPVIDDSERTRLYTGRNVAGAEEGTSISLGWIAELYIDFGKWGMMIAAGTVGLAYGLLQRCMFGWRRFHPLLMYGATVSILLGAVFLESSATKVFGGLMASVIAASAILMLLVPLWCPWLTHRRS